MLSREVMKAAKRWLDDSDRLDPEFIGAGDTMCDFILEHETDYAEDGTPLEVDEGFLKASGGEWDEPSAAFCFRITGFERLFVRTNGQWWLENTSRFGGSAGGRRRVRYRCQFRNLADVVGVALIEAMGV